MKTLTQLSAILLLAPSIHAQQGDRASPASPPPTPTFDTPSAQRLPLANTTDPDQIPAGQRILAERPATVVVKPSNPFSGFRRLDKNGDGTISLYELTNAFHKADENGDERLNLEEFQRGIVDQPLDEGGVPDEPRIIIQQVAEKPVVEPNQRTNARTRPNTNTNTNNTRSSTRRAPAQVDENEDEDVDVELRTDSNPRRPGNRPGGNGSADDENDDEQEEDPVDTPADNETQGSRGDEANREAGPARSNPQNRNTRPRNNSNR